MFLLGVDRVGWVERLNRKHNLHQKPIKALLIHEIQRRLGEKTTKSTTAGSDVDKLQEKSKTINSNLDKSDNHILNLILLRSGEGILCSTRPESVEGCIVRLSQQLKNGQERNIIRRNMKIVMPREFHEGSRRIAIRENRADQFHFEPQEGPEERDSEFVDSSDNVNSTQGQAQFKLLVAGEVHPHAQTVSLFETDDQDHLARDSSDCKLNTITMNDLVHYWLKRNSNTWSSSQQQDTYFVEILRDETQTKNS